MVPQESQADQAKVWDYLVKTTQKADMQDNTVKGSQEEGGKFLPTFHFEQSSNITNFPSSRGEHPGYGGCL